jgi:small subunit ribosomal protein S17
MNDLSNNSANTGMEQNKQKNTRLLMGIVTGASRSKTVSVLVRRYVKHQLLGKVITKSKKYHAHDELDQYKVGDLVEISEGRPVSKTKAWYVVRLVGDASS